MDDRTRMPTLALPFAVVGAAAGWLSVDFLDNPLFGFTPSHAEGLGAVCTSVIAGAVGRSLTRCCAPREEWERPGAMWLQVGCAVLGGGALSGFLVGGLGFENLEGALKGMVAGMGAGAAFLPVCVLVVTAARRAARARLGSLVADADRRELWALMAMALAVTTAVSLPDWLVWETPVAPGMIAGVALGGVVALLVFDVGARLRLCREAATTAAMEVRHGEVALPGDPEPEIDFGLGDEVRARVVRGAAYRGMDRTAALVVGSPARAASAVGRAIAKKALAVAVTGAVVAVHCLAPALPSSMLPHEMMCDLGVNTECRAAALLMDEEGSPHLRARAWTLASRACNLESHPDAEACRHLARMQGRAGSTATGEMTAAQYHARACRYGDAASCRVLEMASPFPKPRFGPPWER
jgi:hypothetical protein